MQSLNQLLSRVWENPPYLIDEGILNEKGMMVIGGPPKSYKSFVLNSLCCHLTAGTNLFGLYRKPHGKDRSIPGFNVSRKCKVLFFEQEIGEYSLKERLVPLVSSLSSEERETIGQNLHIHSCDRDLRLDEDKGINKIADLARLIRPDVIVFDPLVEFHHGDENSTKDMSRVMRGVDWLKDKFNSAVIMSHHCGKANEMRAGADSLRGSSATFGKGDSFFTLSVHNRGAAIIRVEPVIRRGIPIRDFLLKLDWNTCAMRFYDWASSKASKAALLEAPTVSDLQQ